MEFRSWNSVVWATRHPAPTSPSTQPGRTRAPVRNTSQNELPPFICLSGLASTPGWCMSMRKYVRPWCLGRPGSVLASSMPKSAVSAPEFHTFWPSITHSSPSGTARVPTLARSEPEPGSLNSWHQAASPSAIGRTNLATCSGVPCSSRVGAARVAATCPDGGPMTPLAASTPVMARASAADAPRPPRPAGHAGYA